MKINGYDLQDLINQVFSQYDKFTASSIQAQLGRVHSMLKDGTGPLFISVGENCGPAQRLAGAGAPTLGSQFFDNLVTPLDSVAAMIRQGFVDILQIKNLRIGTWEGHDSVFDDQYKMFYHHYFHLNPAELEKSWPEGGGHRRRIDEADIPLFLSVVRAQFEYLAEKFAVIARHAVRKNYVLRKVDGSLPSRDELSSLQAAFEQSGAVNYRMIVVHSDDGVDGGAGSEMVRCLENAAIYCIRENGERWGDTGAWRHLVEQEIKAA